MEWVESTGKSIEDAKDVALDRLGVHEDDAEFEILGDGKVGLFGRVKEEARVRARVRPATPRAKEERHRRPRGGKGRRSSGREGDGQKQRSNDRGNRGQNQEDGPRSDAGRSRTKDGGGSRRKDGGGSRQGDKEKPVSDDQPTMPLSEQADIAQEFVAGLAAHFGATVSFEQTEVDEDIHLTVSGSEVGRMIGRRGNTAMAIDELVRTVLQRQAGSSRNGRIRVDIGGVRARRTEALTQFCLDLAVRVRETRVAAALEPMGASDRKIVHDVISHEDGVDTMSEGEDPNRRVVIVPAGDAD